MKAIPLTDQGKAFLRDMPGLPDVKQRSSLQQIYLRASSLSLLPVILVDPQMEKTITLTLDAQRERGRTRKATFFSKAGKK